MKTRISFLGAARNVTGSRFLLETNGKKILVDCGLYQERDFKTRNWDPFPVPPSSIDAVLLTHGHLDHCGLLPKLVKDGFKGKIYCTSATRDIAQIILLDSAHIQEEDAKFKKKRHEKEGRKGPYPEVPLYTMEDAQSVFPLFSSVEYGETINIEDGITASFHDAGHVLGASMIKVTYGNDGSKRTILFSGDVGRWDKPILRDPTLFEEADYVLVESTYGDRVHEDDSGIDGELEKVINETRKAGGNIVIPSFALERSQELLYHLHDLRIQKRIPRLMVFVDSPMAIKLTEVFGKHKDLFDKEMMEKLRRGESPLDFQGLHLTRTVEESKAINSIRGTAIIIAGSGMCTGGRIKHHLVNNISNPASTILFVGYQAVGTLGRIIVDGKKEVRIHGEKREVRARIARIHGFSAHADKDELDRWLSSLTKAPRKVFVVHGEEKAAENFAAMLRDEKGWNVEVPDYKQEFELD